MIKNKSFVNPEVFVNKTQEEEYFKKYDITHKKMSNEIRLTGMSKRVADINSSNINFVFSSGSYNDPKGKEGIHHMFEHLVMNRIQKNPKSVDIYKNAYTSQTKLIVELDGTSNTKVKSYGVWPMIPDVISVLKSPFENDTESFLQSEVNVVLHELAEQNTKPQYHNNIFLYKCLYDKSNPLRSDTLGTKKSLTSISLSDLEKIANRVFVPKGLTVSVFADGGSNISKSALMEIESELVNFPRENTKPLKVNQDLTDNINPNLKPGDTFENDDGLKNELVTVNFAWVLPSIDLTSHAFSLNRVTQGLNENLLRYTRKKGISYSSSVYSISHRSSQIIIFTLTMKKGIPLSEIKTKLFPEIRDHVIFAINDNELAYINNKEKLIQEAVLMPTRSRFYWLNYGYDYYGKVIDADAIKNLYKSVSLLDLKHWRDKLLEIEPIAIVSGDIS